MTESQKQTFAKFAKKQFKVEGVHFEEGKPPEVWEACTMRGYSTYQIDLAGWIRTQMQGVADSVELVYYSLEPTK